MAIAKRGVCAIAAVVILLCLIPRIWFFIQSTFLWLLILLASFNAVDRRVAQQSGCEIIPQVTEIDALLGRGDHAVSDRGFHPVPNGANDIYQWSTEVYFAGRYQLTMIADIEVDRKSSKVLRVVDAPKFILVEVEWVDMSGGRPSISYNSSAQREFGPADWKKVVEAKGDFSVIGIPLRNDPPIPHFDELVKWSQLRSLQRYGSQ